jgi:phosphatidylserine/phosphatidylglycerophosphate/cardiolipin synthase-like enzyme
MMFRNIFFLKTYIAISCFIFALHAVENQCDHLCEVYFSPKDNVAHQLISLIDQETKSVQIAVYGFTHHGIAAALIKAKKKGVQVEVIVDPFSVKESSPVKRLFKSGIVVWVWKPAICNLPNKEKAHQHNRSSLMHDKFCIFGDHSVWTGSFNFTYNGNNCNEENVVLIKADNVVEKFKQQFHDIKTKGCKPYCEYTSLKNEKLGKKD